jgi:hypothetical protein
MQTEQARGIVDKLG